MVDGQLSCLIELIPSLVPSQFGLCLNVSTDCGISNSGSPTNLYNPTGNPV